MRLFMLSCVLMLSFGCGGDGSNVETTNKADTSTSTSPDSTSDTTSAEDTTAIADTADSEDTVLIEDTKNKVVCTDIVIESTDTVKTKIAATHCAPDGVSTGKPAVVLLHQYQVDRNQWTNYVGDLHGLGYVTVAVDLRGHGSSGKATGTLQSILTDPAQAPVDLKALLAHMIGTLGVDEDRIAIVGTSIGANLACLALAKNYGVKLAVAISARDSSVASLGGDANSDAYTFKGLFIIASENDGGGAQKTTAEKFDKQGTEPKQIKIYSGGLHGKFLLDGQSKLWPQVVNFLEANL